MWREPESLVKLIGSGGWVYHRPKGSQAFQSIADMAGVGHSLAKPSVSGVGSLKEAGGWWGQGQGWRGRTGLKNSAIKESREKRKLRKHRTVRLSDRGRVLSSFLSFAFLPISLPNSPPDPCFPTFQSCPHCQHLKNIICSLLWTNVFLAWELS